MVIVVIVVLMVILDIKVIMVFIIIKVIMVILVIMVIMVRPVVHPEGAKKPNLNQLKLKKIQSNKFCETLKTKKIDELKKAGKVK
jgi:hypothetical protein